MTDEDITLWHILGCPKEWVKVKGDWGWQICKIHSGCIEIPFLRGHGVHLNASNNYSCPVPVVILRGADDEFKDYIFKVTIRSPV